MKKTKVGLSISVLATVLVAMSSAAYAAEIPSPDSPPQEAVEYIPVEPIDAQLWIDGKPTDIAVMPDFDPDAPAVVLDGQGRPVSVNDVELIRADGSAAKVNTVDVAAGRAALAGCSWYNWVAPGTGTWYNSVEGCSFIGLNVSTQVGYSWTVDLNSLGSACLKGRGYQYLTWPGGGGWSAFYGSIGCGSSGSSGGGVLTWGNVASTKAVQMKATSAPVGAAGMFQ